MLTKKEEYIYQKLCVGCPNEKYCHDECITCERFDRLVSNKPHTIPFKELTHKEKCEIYNMYKSGKYYTKEITTKFNITKPTLYKVVKAFDTFFNTGTPKDL